LGEPWCLSSTPEIEKDDLTRQIMENSEVIYQAKERGASGSLLISRAEAASGAALSRLIVTRFNEVMVTSKV